MSKVKRPWLKHSKPQSGRKVEHDPFYWSSRWRKVRRMQLDAEPFCAYCLKQGRTTEARVVDHIQSRYSGGSDFDPDNLQSLCDFHHNQKSSSERKSNNNKREGYQQ